jgi:hypothetical protein
VEQAQEHEVEQAQEHEVEQAQEHDEYAVYAQMAVCVDTTHGRAFSILPRKMPVSDYRNRFHLCGKEDI